jgi:nickel-dependent lactate racemase
LFERWEGCHMAHLVLTETERMEFNIPKGWQVLSHFLPKQIEAASVLQLMEERIRTPVSSKKLEDLIKPHFKVVLIIDDYTRPTPKETVLSFLVKKLDQMGVKKENIHIIVGCGTHRHLEGKELEDAYGEEIVKGYAFSQHDPMAEDMVIFTELSDGTPVKINPLVAKADFCIGIGTIMPHPFNGFGGGGKIILPGVVDYRSIARHHAVNFLKGCGPGNISSSNSFYQEIRAVAEKSNLKFIVNFIMNEKEEPADIVAGDPIQAFEKGVEVFKKYYGIEVKEEADITITSGYPYKVITQSLKPISAAYLATKEGGEIIIGARVERGPELGILDHFHNIFAKYQDAESLLNDFQNYKLPIPDAPLDMNVVFAYVLAFNKKVKVTYVTKDLDKAEVEKLGFQHASSMDEAIQRSYERNKKATINIYPAGGIVLPLKEKNIL